MCALIIVTVTPSYVRDVREMKHVYMYYRL